jgi:hypothetical protein
MEDIDKELEGIRDPPLPSEYLTKRVQSIITNVNLAQDESLRKSIRTLEVDPEFIEKSFINKAKQYDHIPIAYNASLLSSQLR